MRYGLATIAAVAALIAAGPADARWVTSWATAAVPPNAASGPMPATPAFRNQTVRQLLRLSAGGKALRITFTNGYGDRPLRIGAARVALVDARGREVRGSARTLRFRGASGVTVPVGALFTSDAVRMAVPPLARLTVSLFLPDATGPCTCHPAGLQTAQVSPPGNFVAMPFKPASTGTWRAFIASAEVDGGATARTLVAFGDSITDGIGSTGGANRRWPDLLAERLGPRWGVANEGLSGNRILNDGAGQSALARLDRDVFAHPNVRAMILFEGVNDLGLSFGRVEGPFAALMHVTNGDRIDADRIIGAYRQIVARAHARGVRVIGATIAPYKGAMYWSPEGETARRAINRVVRAGGVFDGVIDFDAVLRDPADPAAMRADYHSGDHLHPSDAGYRAMARSIDVRLFGR